MAIILPLPPPLSLSCSLRHSEMTVIIVGWPNITHQIQIGLGNWRHHLDFSYANHILKQNEMNNYLYTVGRGIFATKNGNYRFGTASRMCKCYISSK